MLNTAKPVSPIKNKCITFYVEKNTKGKKRHKLEKCLPNSPFSVFVFFFLKASAYYLNKIHFNSIMWNICMHSLMEFHTAGVFKFLLKKMTAELVVFLPFTKCSSMLSLSAYKISWAIMTLNKYSFYKVRMCSYEVGSCYLILCAHQIDSNLSFISKLVFLLTLGTLTYFVI